MSAAAFVQDNIERKSVFVEYDKIKTNSLNSFPIDEQELSSLQKNISVNGIITPLSVIGPYDDGTYTLISGERRLTAIKNLLMDGGNEHLKNVPVYIVGTKDMTESMQIILIEASNIETRENINRKEHYFKVFAEYRKMADNGTIKDRDMARLASNELGVSWRWASHFKAIMEKGAEGLKDAVIDGSINPRYAARLSSLPEEYQKNALKEIKDEGQRAKDAVSRQIENYHESSEYKDSHPDAAASSKQFSDSEENEKGNKRILKGTIKKKKLPAFNDDYLKYDYVDNDYSDTDNSYDNNYTDDSSEDFGELYDSEFDTEDAQESEEPGQFRDHDTVLSNGRVRIADNYMDNYANQKFDFDSSKYTGMYMDTTGMGGKMKENSRKISEASMENLRKAAARYARTLMDKDESELTDADWDVISAWGSVVNKFLSMAAAI